MADVISAALLAVTTIPMSVALIMISYSELKSDYRTTSAYGMPVVYGLFVVFVVAPLWTYLAS